VIKSGGKQYRVSPGDKIKVESLVADVGQEITLSDILAVSDGSSVRLGTPLVAGASVKATVLSQARHPKITIFKMKRRKHFAKSGGHRQHFTELRIDAIA
jgi:large subunit ribosomal protein L21